jgi:hypothetical protein
VRQARNLFPARRRRHQRPGSDDRLPVRAGPGPAQPKLGSKAGLGEGFRAASRALPQGVGAALISAPTRRCEPSEAKERRILPTCFYGVVSAQTEKVVEFYLEREAAEAMIGEVREDEPVLAEELRVEAIELTY